MILLLPKTLGPIRGAIIQGLRCDMSEAVRNVRMNIMNMSYHCLRAHTRVAELRA